MIEKLTTWQKILHYTLEANLVKFESELSFDDDYIIKLNGYKCKILITVFPKSEYMVECFYDNGDIFRDITNETNDIFMMI